MNIDFDIKSGATGPDLLVTLMDGDLPLNLTGATVTFRMRPIEGGPLTINHAPATVVAPATEGQVSYQWQAADTALPGIYEGEFVVTFLSGQTQVFPKDSYVMIEVEASLDNDAPVTLPSLPSNCWPVDETVCHELDEYSASVQMRAKALAANTLYMLTGYSVGGCPITVRPRRTVCSDHSYLISGTFRPVNVAGVWSNSCGCSSGLPANVIELALPVGRVDEVKVDGVVLDPAAYELASGRYLVRIDGTAWPLQQDVTKPDTEVGTFSITYLRAMPVDGLGAYAAGVLACEFAKAISGSKCALPSGVTSITRQGVTMSIPSGAFPDGLTGIREVDAYVRSHNPHGLKMPSAVISPDRPQQWTTS